MLSEYDSDFSSAISDSSDNQADVFEIKKESSKTPKSEFPYFLRFSSNKNQCYANAIMQAFLHLGDLFRDMVHIQFLLLYI